MTSWVLLVYMTVDRGAAMDSIQNLKSLEECHRVEQVIKDWKKKQRHYSSDLMSLCVEVVNK